MSKFLTHAELVAKLKPCLVCGVKVYEGIVCSWCKEVRW